MCIKFHIFQVREKDLTRARSSQLCKQHKHLRKESFKKKFRLGRDSNRWLPPAIERIGSWSRCEFAIHPKKVKLWKFIYLNCGSTIQVLKIERCTTKAVQRFRACWLVERYGLKWENCLWKRRDHSAIIFSRIENNFSRCVLLSPVQMDATLLANSSQHCCTPCYMLLRVVRSCCAKFETGQTFSYVQTDATKCWE